jgi:hypothetical protein
VQTIPREIAARVPQKAREIVKSRKELTRLCHSKDFSIAEFIQKAKELES